MKNTKTVCQSCALPILSDYENGTESNGILTGTYCRRCYRFGAFTDPKMTVEMMHEDLRLRMIGMKFPRFLAKLMANKVYTLERWETAKS